MRGDAAPASNCAQLLWFEPGVHRTSRLHASAGLLGLGRCGLAQKEDCDAHDTEQHGGGDDPGVVHAQAHTRRARVDTRARGPGGFGQVGYSHQIWEFLTCVSGYCNLGGLGTPQRFTMVESFDQLLHSRPLHEGMVSIPDSPKPGGRAGQTL